MQFYVYRNKSKESANRVPYLLDVQSDLLSTLATRAVVPLYAASSAATKGLPRLMPVFTLNQTQFVMVTTELAGVPLKLLGEVVADLTPSRIEIVGALDFLISGV